MLFDIFGLMQPPRQQTSRDDQRRAQPVAQLHRFTRQKIGRDSGKYQFEQEQDDHAIGCQTGKAVLHREAGGAQHDAEQREYQPGLRPDRLQLVRQPALPPQQWCGQQGCAEQHAGGLRRHAQMRGAARHHIGQRETHARRQPYPFGKILRQRHPEQA